MFRSARNTHNGCQQTNKQKYTQSKGCKITDKDDGGNTPLHCAVRAGKMDMVLMLVKLGADVNAKNDFDDTAMKIAEDKGLISIISFLAANGATPVKKSE